MLSEEIRLLHSCEWRSLSEQQQIKHYLEAIGIPDELTEEQAWNRLELRFPDELQAFGEATADMIETERSAVYACKNVSLEFSLLVGVCGRGAVHRSIMRWLSEAHLQPRRVLDVGCDNGMLTSFYALLWPNASIVGIDLSPDGVDGQKNSLLSWES